MCDRNEGTDPCEGSSLTEFQPSDKLSTFPCGTYTKLSAKEKL